MSVPRISSSLLAAVDGVAHAFFGRQGGVSEGVFESLNCSRWCGDERAAVEANIERAGAVVGVRRARVFANRQVHGCRVRRVHRGDAAVDAAAENVAEAGAVFAGDALVTVAPGVALGVLSADCAPVLLADPAARVSGAAHAGWRGALAGVVEATVAAMVQLGARPARIVCAIGPAIQRDSYRVGDDWARRFRAASPVVCDGCFHRGDGDHYFDLPAYLRLRLASAGVEAVDVLPHDTVTDAQFFSHRRSCGKPCGRQLSLIALR